MANPVFGFLAFTSGSYEGAIIRDMRLANSLHRRGFKVVVYWLMETNDELVDRGIHQSIIFRGPRFLRRRPSLLIEQLSLLLNGVGRSGRRRFIQRRPWLVARALKHFVATMCDGWSDPGVVRRLERRMISDGVTHLLPTFAMTCPLALAVKQRGRHSFEFLPTFQGEEIFANYAAELNRLDDYYAQLRRCVAASPWPAVVVSDDYGKRLHDEIGLDANRMTTIYPGIELPPEGDKPPFELLARKMPTLDPNVPIISYFGRQDTEKGIDLLLYAGRLLRERGVRLQIVVCGGSSFGLGYHDSCRQIAEHLRINVFWRRRINDDVRAALYAHSRCIVYPAIHREPFGMVAAECMSHGTPVIVPNHGGITEVISREGRAGGLTFKAWDTCDLADQMQRMIRDDALHETLARDTRSIARSFSTDHMTDKVLQHLGFAATPVV